MEWKRRRFLASISAVGLTGIAGCSGGDDAGDSDAPSGVSDAEPTEKPTKFSLPPCGDGDYAIQFFGFNRVVNAGADETSISLKNLQTREVELSAITLYGDGERQRIMFDGDPMLAPRATTEINIGLEKSIADDKITDVRFSMPGSDKEGTCY